MAEALRIARAPAPDGVEPLTLGLACGFSPLHLVTFLAASLRRACGRSARILTGHYNDLPGNIERLVAAHSARPEALVVAIEWADVEPRLDLRRLGGWSPDSLPDVLEGARRRLQALQGAIAAAAGRLPVVVAPPTLPLPPIAYQPTWQAGSFETQLRLTLAEFVAQLATSPGVRVVSTVYLDRHSPPAERLDLRSEVNAGFPYRLPHAAVLGEALAHLLAPQTPLKGLITDLDETLWAGLLGEVGVEGVAWDLDRQAQRHGLYQQMLAALAGAGVLVAVASKNDPKLVEQALRRDDLLLPGDRIFPVEAHWQPKSESVGRILGRWNVGADAVVFIDDNPMELAEVAASHPGLHTRLFPQDEAGLDALLTWLRDAFGKSQVTAEDQVRQASLRRAAGPSLDAGAASNPGFVEGLDAEIVIDFARNPDDPRPLELVNKTNQFNLNGRRYGPGQWQGVLDDPTRFVMVASYRDRFGPLGKIAVLVGRDQGDGRVVVDSWVMSCRAFARRIEHACLARVFERLGARCVGLDFAPTLRNGPTQEFLRSLAGDREPEPGVVWIDRDAFRHACPTLSHRVREIAYE